jgi:hypothetical protein
LFFPKIFTLLKEYGSNVQKLADHITAMQDREKRTLYAHILVELMRQIHPNMKDNQDYYNKLWDDLYIISGFELDVESPYPPPSKEVLGRKPLRVDYNQQNLTYKHYGRNVELLIEKAIQTEDKDDRLAFVSYLFRLMRSFYNSWNKDNPEDAVLLEHLEDLSEGQLKEEVAYIRQNGPIEASPKDRNSNPERGRSSQPTGYQAQTNTYTPGNDRSSSNTNTNRNRHNNKFSKNNNNNRNRRK